MPTKLAGFFNWIGDYSHKIQWGRNELANNELSKEYSSDIACTYAVSWAGKVGEVIEYKDYALVKIYCLNIGVGVVYSPSKMAGILELNFAIRINNMAMAALLKGG